LWKASPLQVQVFEDVFWDQANDQHDSRPKPGKVTTSLRSLIALALRERVEKGPKQLFRLVGVGLSNFQTAEEPASPLFVEEVAQEQ
jgi:hypothetical protein